MFPVPRHLNGRSVYAPVINGFNTYVDNRTIITRSGQVIRPGMAITRGPYGTMIRPLSPDEAQAIQAEVQRDMQQMQQEMQHDFADMQRDMAEMQQEMQRDMAEMQRDMQSAFGRPQMGVGPMGGRLMPGPLVGGGQLPGLGAVGASSMGSGSQGGSNVLGIQPAPMPQPPTQPRGPGT